MRMKRSIKSTINVVEEENKISPQKIERQETKNSKSADSTSSISLNYSDLDEKLIKIYDFIAYAFD